MQIKRDKNGKFIKGSTSYNKGSNLSDETKNKLSQIHKKKYKDGYINPRTGEKHSEETKKKIGKANSLSLKGRKLSEEIKKKISKSHKGKIISKETRKKISESQKGKAKKRNSGCNHWNWKGGISTENMKIRSSLDYTIWRRTCLIRDNFICQKNQKTNRKLEVHHIFGFNKSEKLRFVLNNGITLSQTAHKEFHKIYGKKNNTKEQLLKFLDLNNTKIDRSNKITGNGDIAEGLVGVKCNTKNLLFFARGVSDSSNKVKKSEYEREENMILEQDRSRHIVYFSTLSIFYKNDNYQKHKRKMEELIKDNFLNYTIIRLGNVTWGKNKKHLVNFLKDKIFKNESFNILDVYRYLVDISDFQHWISLIPNFNCEMNVTGIRMKVADIVEGIKNGTI